MAGILEQILAGVQKLPGNAIGAPVDLANTILNIGKAGYGYLGSKAGLLDPSDLPTISDDPFGGSKSINRAFGLGESKGVVDELVQMGGGLVTPGNIGFMAKAVVLPAIVLHDASTVNTAGKLIGAGREDQVYKATKIFQGLEDSAPLKAVLPDTGASLKSVGGVLRSSNGNVTVSPLARNLGDVLDHPALFKAVPKLADYPIMAMPGGPGGSYNTANDMIKIGEYPTEERFLSTVLHETQHAIQEKFEFTGGGNPGLFLRDQTALSEARTAANKSYDNMKDIGGVNLPDIKNRADVLNTVADKAYKQYLRIGGELEAQVVQAQFTSGNYSQSPAKLAIEQAGGKENIITEPLKMPKLDDEEAVRSIISHYTTGL